MEDVLLPRMLIDLVEEEVKKRMAPPAHDFLKQCYETMQKSMISIIKRICAVQGKLKNQMQVDVLKELEDVRCICQTRLTEIVAQESSDVYTLNHYYQENMTKWRAKQGAMFDFVKEKQQPIVSLIGDDQQPIPVRLSLSDDEIVQEWNASVQLEEVKDQLNQQSPNTDQKYVASARSRMSNEEAAGFDVQLMFVSYRQVVRKRLLDNVVIMVRYFYTGPFLQELRRALLDRVNSKQSLKEILNEPHVLRKRGDLEGRLRELQSAEVILRGVL